MEKDNFNHLKIILTLTFQDDTLKGEVSSVDISTKENMENLAKVAEGLLKKPVSRVNLETGNLEPSKHETNEEALIRCKIVQIFTKYKKIRIVNNNNSFYPNNAGLQSYSQKRSTVAKPHHCRNEMRNATDVNLRTTEMI